MRLGRLPHDPVALARLPSLMSHPFALREPKPALDRRAVAFVPRMFGNDTLPVCTVAGLANAMLAVSALAGWELEVDDARVPPFFASVVGCQPTQAAIAATPGANVVDVLRRQMAGFAIGQPEPYAALFGTIAPDSRIGLANGIDEFGIGYWGIDLYERDMEAFAARDPWDDDGRDPGNLVGGHVVGAWDYDGLADDDHGRCASWGHLQPFTWRWAAARLREAHGLYWRQLDGVDADRIAAELAAWNRPS